MKKANFYNYLNKIAPHTKLVILTSVLYPKNRGYTMYNLTNIALSKLYNSPVEFEKFNANSSAAVLFGCLAYHILDPVNFNKWLKQEGINMTSEKIVHILPFIYYWKQGYYYTPNYKISALSLIYELIWAYRCAGGLNMTVLYHKLNKHIYWSYVWLVTAIGHFNYIDNKFVCKLLKGTMLRICFNAEDN
tara:strand:+ start:442 stop:1011 length:570 start_codon:yes stop_codon:yes gene_type:complete